MLRNCAVQFMENFCYERKTLFSFAKHHETGEPLPEELYQKLCAARTFRAGSMMMRQVAATHPACMSIVLWGVCRDGGTSPGVAQSAPGAARTRNGEPVCQCQDAHLAGVQLHFSLLDLELHARYTPGGDRSVFDVDQVAPGSRAFKPTWQSSD